MRGKTLRLICVAVVLFYHVIVGSSKGAFAYYLPDTSQTKCYQDVSPYAEIPCAGTGQDGAYNINPKSYTDNSDGTVTDNNTGLMWQKQDDGNTYDWYQATQNVCGLLNIGGHSDWRLPSRKELITIVDYSIPAPGPTINPVFTNTGSSYYWSSNLDAHIPIGGGAWGVRFSDGYISNSQWVGATFRVRCVRGAQELPTFKDNGNGTVTDERTGTVWQKEDDDILRTWGEALSYCEGLNLAGQSDWRLPNIIELESIVDDTREQPAIDPVFTNAKAYPYCSSTSYTASPSYAWFVIFGAGEAAYNDDGITKGYSYYVRCARGGQAGLLGKLSISKNGTGIGTVVSLPSGINCGGFCSTYYPINSSVVLTATPSTGGSIFSGWSNDPDCLDGAVTLNADKSCTATFDLCNSMSVAMTDSAGPFDSISAAYEGASLIDTLRIIASNQAEGDLVFAGKNLTLQGGYDCAFTEPPSAYTTITGSLTISSGSITVDRIVIASPFSVPSIAGTWYKTPPDSNAAELLTLDTEGVVWYGVYQPYYPGDPAIGYQHGTYTWDSGTGELTFTGRDANTAGDWGFPLETVTVTFQSANQISIHYSTETFIMNRLTASSTNPILGTWQAFKLNQTSGDKVANFIATANGYYMLTNLDGPDNVDGIPGLEYGTYTFNPSNGVFAVTPLADTSRHWGISPDSSQITLSIIGTIMKVGNSDGVTTLQRLEP